MENEFIRVNANQVSGNLLIKQTPECIFWKYLPQQLEKQQAEGRRRQQQVISSMKHPFKGC